MITAAVLTVSDSTFRGTREDRSGPALKERIESLGWSVAETGVVPDDADAISEKLTDWADRTHIPVIFTTGGTGAALRDVTPEATRAILDREIPGIPELMRSEGRRSTMFAVLSRGVAGSRGTTLIVNLPGSMRGAVESFDAVSKLVPHVVDLLHGETEHKPG